MLHRCFKFTALQTLRNEQLDSGVCFSAVTAGSYARLVYRLQFSVESLCDLRGFFGLGLKATGMPRDNLFAEVVAFAAATLIFRAYLKQNHSRGLARVKHVKALVRGNPQSRRVREGSCIGRVEWVFVCWIGYTRINLNFPQD